MTPELRDVNFGETILDLQRKRAELLKQKTSIDHQIWVIDKTVESLIFLGNPESKMPLPKNLNEMGVQDAVRAVLRRAFPIYLLPTEIRDTLISAGMTSTSPKNLLITIHTAISRMEDELEEEARPGGKTAYRWKVLRAEKD
jgi:hypothetical protein